MRHQNRNITNKKVRWPFWIALLIGLVILMCLFYLFYLYYTIQKGEQAQYSKIETEILDETDLEEIDQIKPFYDEHTYHIAFGKTDDNKEKVVFMPDSKENDELMIEQSEIIPKQQMVKQVTDQCSQCKIKKVNPAIIDDHPLWEVTYRDESNRYIFDYFSMYDGERYEQLRLKQIFK